MLYPDTSGKNVICGLHPSSDSSGLYRREGSKAQARVTVPEKLKQGDAALARKGWPDSRGDANDFYKSGGTHAACRHTVTPTNCLLTRGCPD